jgi:hypothetical protein
MVSVPLRAEVDPAHGGRWTSLRTSHREWLWRGPQPGRAAVAPGDAFVDAGGLEECVPTVRGTPDHGAVWSRPWDGDAVSVPQFELRRRLSHVDGAVVADYELTAVPGFRFLWAAHALLDLSPEARLEAPADAAVRLIPETGPPTTVTWAAAGLARLGPDDGTATGAVLTGCPEVRVVDGADALTFRLDCAGQPTSTALWRNLRGWPAGQPYRSIGVEPMLGRVFDLAAAHDWPDAATVPPGGTVTWRLRITCERATDGPA